MLEAVSSVLCGQPTPTGPCRRPVTTPGGPCGVEHVAAPGPAAAAGGPVPAGGPGPDPFTGGPDGAGSGLDSEMAALAEGCRVCHQCGEPVAEDSSPGVFVHDRDLDDAWGLDEDHPPVPFVDITEGQSTLVKRWFGQRRPSHPDWDRHRGLFTDEYSEWYWEIDSGGHPAQRPGDPQATPAALDVWADHPNPDVAAAVAAHDFTEPATLARLAAHPDPAVRAAAAANPNCPSAARAHAGLLAD